MLLVLEPCLGVFPLVQLGHGCANSCWHSRAGSLSLGIRGTGVEMLMQSQSGSQLFLEEQEP